MSVEVEKLRSVGAVLIEDNHLDRSFTLEGRVGGGGGEGGGSN